MNKDMTQKHTPTPWIARIHGQDVFIVGPLPGRKFLAKLNPLQSADTEPALSNAAYIVKACNSYEGLLKALKDLVAADNCNYWRDTMRAEGLFDAAREAIAEAEQRCDRESSGRLKRNRAVHP